MDIIVMTNARPFWDDLNYTLETNENPKVLGVQNSIQNGQKQSPEGGVRVSFLIKLQAEATLLKKRLWHRCFPVNFG